MRNGAGDFVTNIAVMAPSIFLLYYLLPYVLPSVNIFVFSYIIIIPFLHALTPRRLRYVVYPLAVIAFLIVVLVTIMIDSSLLLQNYILQYFTIPLNAYTFISIISALGVLFTVEGIFSDRIYKTAGFLMISLASLLDQLAIVTVMLNNNYTYFYAYTVVNAEEVFSLYTLFVDGFQKVLPLATLNIPVNRELLITFIISIAGILISLYRSGRERDPEILNRLAYPVFLGSVLGLGAFAFLEFMTTYSFQFTAVAVSILATVIALAVTSRQKPEIKEEPV